MKLDIVYSQYSIHVHEQLRRNRRNRRNKFSKVLETTFLEAFIYLSRKIGKISFFSFAPPPPNFAKLLQSLTHTRTCLAGCAPTGCQGQRRQGEASSQGVQEVRFATKEGVPNSLAQNNNKNIIVLATGTSWHLKFRPGTPNLRAPKFRRKFLRKIGKGLLVRDR